MEVFEVGKPAPWLNLSKEYIHHQRTCILCL